MIDATDRKILDALSRDGALTGEQLGERIGLSPSAAHRRVKLLEQAGLIAGYRAVLSEEAKGYPSEVLVSVTLEDQRRETLDRFERTVARCPHVRECHLVSGQADYILKVNFTKPDIYESVHRDLLELPGVRQITSQIVIRTIVSHAP